MRLTDSQVRKSWHSQATWLLCLSNISSCTWLYCLSSASTAIIGVHDLEVLTKGTKQILKAWRKEPLLTSHMKWSVQNSLLLPNPSQFQMFKLDWLSIHKTIWNEFRRSSQIHRNYSGSSCLVTTIDLSSWSVLVSIMFLCFAWTSSLSFEHNRTFDAQCPLGLIFGMLSLMSLLSNYHMWPSTWPWIV